MTPDYQNDNVLTIETKAPAIDPAIYMPPLPQHPITHPCTGCPRWVGASNDLVLNYETKRAYYNKVDVNLTAGEFRVVARLIAGNGEYVSYRAIYDVIQRPGFVAGDGVFGINGNVRSFIKRVRRKFEKLNPKFNSISNYQAMGYAWTK
jgi:DNA-binding response OmpR family regulator